MSDAEHGNDYSKDKRYILEKLDDLSEEIHTLRSDEIKHLRTDVAAEFKVLRAEIFEQNRRDEARLYQVESRVTEIRTTGENLGMFGKFLYALAGILISLAAWLGIRTVTGK